MSNHDENPKAPSKNPEESATSQHKQLSPEELDRLQRMAAEMPGLLEYAHSVGGAPVVPTEEGAIKNKALQAMQQQTGTQMNMLADFMKLAMHHAQKLQDRTKVSLNIYDAKIQFQPQIGKEYWLYKRSNGKRVLSLVSPEEWGKGPCPLGSCQARVKLLADHTWELVHAFEDFDL